MICETSNSNEETTRKDKSALSQSEANFGHDVKSWCRMEAEDIPLESGEPLEDFRMKRQYC